MCNMLGRAIKRVAYRVLSRLREEDFKPKLEQLQWLPEPLIDHIGIHYVIGGMKYYARPTPLAGVTVAKEMATGRALVARLTQTPPREIRLYSADGLYVGMAAAFTAFELPGKIMIATAMHVWKHVTGGSMVINNGSADKRYLIDNADYWTMLESDENELDLVIIVVERTMRAWIEKSAFVRPLVYADMRRAIDRCNIYSVSGNMWTESYGVVTPHNGLQLRYVIETAAGSSGGPIIAGKHLVGIHVQGRVTSSGPCNFGVYLPMLIKSFRNRLPQKERSNKRNQGKKAYVKPNKSDKSYDDENEDQLDDYYAEDEQRADKYAARYRLALEEDKELVPVQTVSVNGKVYNSMDDVPQAEYDRWISGSADDWSQEKAAQKPPLPRTPAPDITRKERAEPSQGKVGSREETPGIRPGKSEHGNCSLYHTVPNQQKEAAAGPSGLSPEKRMKVVTWSPSLCSRPVSHCQTGSDQIESSGTKPDDAGDSKILRTLLKEETQKNEVSSSTLASSPKIASSRKKRSKKRRESPKISAEESARECIDTTVKVNRPMRTKSLYLE